MPATASPCPDSSTPTTTCTSGRREATFRTARSSSGCARSTRCGRASTPTRSGWPRARRWPISCSPAARCRPTTITCFHMAAPASSRPWSRRRGARRQSHLAETLDDERFCLEKFGRRPVELMEDQGWIGDDVWYAHGVHLNDAEVDRIAEVKTGIAHCPSSNMRLGAGACRVEDLVRAGARVGLGVDGSASNEDANLAMEAHQALLLARVRSSSPSALDARTAWRLATQGGAECLGREDCGTLEPGKCADIAYFRVA